MLIFTVIDYHLHLIATVIMRIDYTTVVSCSSSRLDELVRFPRSEVIFCLILSHLLAADNLDNSAGNFKRGMQIVAAHHVLDLDHSLNFFYLWLRSLLRYHRFVTSMVMLLHSIFVFYILPFIDLEISDVFDFLKSKVLPSIVFFLSR